MNEKDILRIRQALLSEEFDDENLDKLIELINDSHKEHEKMASSDDENVRRHAV